MQRGSLHTSGGNDGSYNGRYDDQFEPARAYLRPEANDEDGICALEGDTRNAIDDDTGLEEEGDCPELCRLAIILNEEDAIAVANRDRIEDDTTCHRYQQRPYPRFLMTAFDDEIIQRGEIPCRENQTDILCYEQRGRDSIHERRRHVEGVTAL